MGIVIPTGQKLVHIEGHQQSSLSHRGSSRRNIEAALICCAGKTTPPLPLLGDLYQVLAKMKEAPFLGFAYFWFL